MTVVCDTSPLCYLILINHVEILPPSWLDIQPVTTLLPDLPSKLGAGEQEAISLAFQLNATLIILDDMDARVEALQRNLTVTGLLGILYRAGTQELIDFPNAIKQLQQTTFRASSTLIQSLLNRYHQEQTK
ncbi:hypothetical protein NIES4071_62740 [Calothrix sp. NIES-4071]|nr:hypothetical protein NIES4071_62740 [Calothrix sp. NIES-4071]BAZ60577.1 hypothetical protein NIES4105_62690 [Calothrix sp. NIES-4105]